MRIIAVSSIHAYIKVRPDTSGHFKHWIELTRKANWEQPWDVLQTFNSASILSNDRVKFRIGHGMTSTRLIVDISYQYKIVFITWIGTHAEADKINQKNITYESWKKKYRHD